ncbi:MAG: aspartyl protease family protein [archaeon]
MRIPLSIENLGGAIRPILIFTVRIPQLRVNRPVKALVDTGSPSSLINDADAKLMQIPQSQLTAVRSTYVAGNHVTLCSIDKEMILKMFDDQNKLIDIRFPLLVAINQGNAKTENITILGVDFLEKNNLALYFDPANKVGYLETVLPTTN